MAVMVVCCNSSREHENSSRQGRRAGEEGRAGWGNEYMCE